MPWKTMEAEEQKVRFVVAATRQEKSLTALCEEFGISRPTGYLWWRAIEKPGWRGSRSAGGDRSRGQSARRQSWSRALWSCGGAIRTGAHANCRCCWHAITSH